MDILYKTMHDFMILRSGSPSRPGAAGFRLSKILKLYMEIFVLSI